jgi:hypothetical protein
MFYLRSNPGGRSSGVASSINIELDRVLAEFSFWPLGSVLTFDDVPVDGAIDLSSWFEVGYHEKRDITLTAPCQWALTAYPCELRSAETIAAERARRVGP